MHRISNANHRYFARQVFYVLHGEECRTLAIFGMQAMVRLLLLEGLPEVEGFEWSATFYDMHGRNKWRKSFFTLAASELVFDSQIFFRDAPFVQGKRSGSIRIEFDAVRFNTAPTQAPKSDKKNFNGIFMVSRPGQFVTGTHMYHGVAFYSPWTIIKHYAKAVLKLAGRQLADLLGGPAKPRWEGDAISAAIVHGGRNGSTGIAIFHNDRSCPGFTSFYEYRNEAGEIYRKRLPPLAANTTTKLGFAPAKSALDGSGEFGQVLFANPPLGLSRMILGEEAPDGTLSLDHTYFQQPLNSTWGKVEEVGRFNRGILSARIIGPSNPWPLVHDAKTESLVATFNQFDPANRYVLDLHVFTESGEHVVCLPRWITLEPYAFHIMSISEVLRKQGIENMFGTYLLSFNAETNPQELPTRLHTQAIYRFERGNWSAVSGDAHIWSSPAQPMAAIEQLSPAKIRRRQLYYVPVVESDVLETHVALANLSYSLDYAESQTLRLQYFRGTQQLGESEVTLPPFGAQLVSVRELFGKFFASSGGSDVECGSVTVYPKTGKTYCASFIIKDRASGSFVIDHTLVVPKFENEK